MRELRTINTADLANLSRALIGFDNMFQHIESRASNTYPPHNVLKLSETDYEIELAVAGFAKEDITVEIDQNQLTIRGVKKPVDESVEYQYRGLALRNFEKTLVLTEFLEVRGAEVKDGMLKIQLELLVPEALKPRQIEIK